MGLSDSRYSRYLGTNKTEGNFNSHGAQSVQWQKRTGRSPQSSLQTWIQPVLLSQEHYSLLPASLLFSYRSQTQQTSTMTKAAITGTSLKYSKDRITLDSQYTLATCWRLYLLQVWLCSHWSCTSTHLTRQWSSTVPQVPSTPYKPWRRMLSQVFKCRQHNIISQTRATNNYARFASRYINSWPHWRHDLRHLLHTFWGGPGLSGYGSYSWQCSWAIKTEIQLSWSIRYFNFHNVPG